GCSGTVGTIGRTGSGSRGAELYHHSANEIANSTTTAPISWSTALRWLGSRRPRRGGRTAPARSARLAARRMRRCSRLSGRRIRSSALGSVKAAPLTKSSSNTVSSNSAAMADLSGTRGRSPSRLVDAAPEPTSDDLEPVTSPGTGPRDQPHLPFILRSIKVSWQGRPIRVRAREQAFDLRRRTERPPIRLESHFLLMWTWNAFYGEGEFASRTGRKRP